jgi:hypothetical protein
VLNKYKNLLPERAVTELIPNEPKTVHVYDSKVRPVDVRWLAKKEDGWLCQGDGWLSREVGG